MITIPEKDHPETGQQYEIMMNKLGPTTMGFLLEIAEELNALAAKDHYNLVSGIEATTMGDLAPSYSVNPPESESCPSPAQKQVPKSKTSPA